MNLKQAYSFGVQFLEANNVDEADFKALCIACYVAGIKNSEYLAHINDDIIISRVAKMLWRVKSGEPLQYVLGKWDFYESEFYVGEGVLIPRPETEELVDLAVKYIAKLDNPVIVDLCAGSGCIGLSLAKKTNGTVYLIEKSADAFKYLEKNSKEINNAKLINGDIADSFDLPPADVIISNPPYIRTSEISVLQSEVQNEPVMALDGGKDGLDFYRIINDKWSAEMKKGAKLFLEIGNEQGNDVKSILTEFENIGIIKDIFGNNRIVVADKR